MSRFLPILFAILLVGLLIYLLYPKPQLEWIVVEQRDLELSFVIPYRLDLTVAPVRASHSGTFTPFLEAGEKVEVGRAVGILRGSSEVTLQAPQAGIVAFPGERSGLTVREGEPLFVILPGEGTLEFRLTTEQAHALEKQTSLEVEFPFSHQRVWIEPTRLVEEGDGWSLRATTIDFLAELVQHPEGQLRVYSGLLVKAVVIPVTALRTEGGELGVLLEQGGEPVFQAVQVRAAVDGMVAVEGLQPPQRVIKR
ncbi:MAG: hypothetical protein NTV14_01135 [Coprothermobacterota bacterium]|nr:hypothetical protein [Coprothermobacterota bacterium]